MVAKPRHLEELHFTIRSGIGSTHIEAIGNSCPMLTSFSCNGFKCKLPTHEYNDFDDQFRNSSDDFNEQFRNIFALAIRKSMSNL